MQGLFKYIWPTVSYITMNPQNAESNKCEDWINISDKLYFIGMRLWWMCPTCYCIFKHVYSLLHSFSHSWSVFDVSIFVTCQFNYV